MIFKYLSKGCRKRALGHTWEGFPALSNIWSSVEDLHLCNDSISTDVTQTCTVLADAFLPVSDKNLHIVYCYFRMYQVLGSQSICAKTGNSRNTTSHIQIFRRKLLGLAG